MSQNKPKLSDITRQNNSARVSKFASSMIPTPPIQTEEPKTAPIDQSSSQQLAEVSTQESDVTGTASSVDAIQPASTPNEQASVAKPTTRKKSASLNLEEVLNPKVPEQEGFGKMARIAEKHHELLRELSFKYRKNMNTLLYNLLEVLDQAYQREKQNNA